MHVLLVILAFLWWWPLGLLLLGFVLARRGFFRRAYYAGDGAMMDCGHGMERWERKFARAQEKVERVRQRMEMRAARRGWFTPSGSGNRAFDEYRDETLRRLEDEQREFKDFLERLRFAKDRAEFDQFMAERRQRPAGPDSPPPSPPQA
jgi:hypothetical protein